MDRTPISTLLQSDQPFWLGRIDDATAKEHGISNPHDSIGIFVHTQSGRAGKLVAFVGEDDLFDCDGNRFYLDE